MKKLISVVAVTLSLMLLLSMAAFSTSDSVTSTGSGFSNVEFSNGYRGFCIDQNLSGAYSGDGFSVADSTNVATNNTTGADVSQKLKILFTQCFEQIFVSDGNGGYVMDSLKADSSVQTAVWNITDGRYIWGEAKNFVQTVDAYTGPEIPDEGYARMLDNGDVITFYFMVVEPQNNEGQQSFFAYKITVGQQTPHEHSYSEDWSSNETEHWHECACGDKTDLGTHEGNTPDCTTPSICEECEKQLADKDKTNHTGGTEIRNSKEATTTQDGYTGDTYCLGCDTVLEWGSVIPMSHEHSYYDEWNSDDTNHWHECSCKDRKDEEAHKFVLGTCSVCGKTSSSLEIDPDEIADAVGSILGTIIDAGSDLNFGDLGLDFGDLGFGSGNGNGSDTGNGSNGGSDGNNGTGSDNNSGSNTNSGSSSDSGADTDTKPGTDNEQTGSNGNSDTDANTNDSNINKDDNTVSPDTGSGYVLGFVISVMLVSTCALAVIRKKESLTA